MQIAGIVLSVILVTTMVSFLYFNNQNYSFSKLNGLYCDNQPIFSTSSPSEIEFGGDLVIGLNVTSPADLSLVRANISISDSTSTYSESIDLLFTPVNRSSSTSLSLNFGNTLASSSDLLALRPGNYTLVSFSIQYLMCLEYQISEIQIEKKLEVNDNKIENRADKTSWSIEESEYVAGNVVSNTTYTISGSILHFGQNDNDRILNLTSSIILSGILEIELQGLKDMQISLYLDGQFNGTAIGNYSYPIVTLVGLHNVSIGISLPANISGSLRILLLTKNIKILTAVIDDQWSSTFPSAEYYLELVNRRFTRYFNISFSISVSVPIIYPGNSDLLNLINYAENSFAEQFGVGKWQRDRVYTPSNAGINLLLILTNKTMDHYGIVLGDLGGPFNIAVNAGGSVFAGGQKLSASWGDNLIQHEISHVFGALDRYSSDDPPSVMTKSSSASEVISDILNNRLWLTLTNWLNIDLLLMKALIENFYA